MHHVNFERGWYNANKTVIYCLASECQQGPTLSQVPLVDYKYGGFSLIDGVQHVDRWFTF